MPSPQPYALFRHIRKLAAAQDSSRRSDRQLLQQFLSQCDEDAFTALVQRHGAMVLGVSRSVLHHQQDAEDVLQATFLVLARKAHTIRKHESLGSWLHGVAFRLAMKVKVQSRRQRNRELARATPAAAVSVDDLTLKELRAILHEEINGLAEKYRGALLLCYWEGKTRDEAAEQIGMSTGAFKKCLERARNLLGSRLARRGLIPSAAFFAMLFGDSGLQAALPISLTKTTAHAALAFAAGHRAGVSASVAALAEGAIHTMNLTKWATTILAVLVTCGLTVGIGLAGYRLLPGNQVGVSVAMETVSLEPIAAAKAGESDKDRIVGIWRIDSGMENGREMPSELKVLLRINFTKDGKFALVLPEAFLKQVGENGPSKNGKYELVGANKIDIQLDKKDASPGIFKFDGKDHLSLCISNQKDKRPTEFKADKGSDQILFRLVRAKPGEETPTAKEIAEILKKKGGLEGAAKARSANNLKQVALAFHNYESAFNHLPTHAIYSKDGKTPLLSWRVAILPFIEENQLYQEFKLDESWDSKHNIKLAAKMPQIYRLPGENKAKEGETHYQVITGAGTVFDGAKKMKFNDIKDGTSNTIMLVEAKDPVVWSKPDDLPLPKDPAKRPALGGHFKDGFYVGFCDGSVRFLPADIATEKLRAYLTASAGD